MIHGVIIPDPEPDEERATRTFVQPHRVRAAGIGGFVSEPDGQPIEVTNLSSVSLKLGDRVMVQHARDEHGREGWFVVAAEC